MRAAEQLARGAMGDDETLLRSGDGDVSEPPLFVELFVRLAVRLIDALDSSMVSQGSSFRFFNRFGTVRTSNRSFLAVSISSQAIGIDTVPSGRARVEYAATELALRALRR